MQLMPLCSWLSWRIWLLVLSQLVPVPAKLSRSQQGWEKTLLGCDSLAGVDIYSFEQKINHIARHVRLPQAPALGPGASALRQEEQIPPILVINVQLPIYSVRH